MKEDVTACGLYHPVKDKFVFFRVRVAVPEAVERQHLIDLAQSHFPGRAGIFDAGLRACACAAGIAGNEDHIGMRFRNPCRDRSDAGRADRYP